MHYSSKQETRASSSPTELHLWSEICFAAERGPKITSDVLWTYCITSSEISMSLPVIYHYTCRTKSRKNAISRYQLITVPGLAHAKSQSAVISWYLDTFVWIPQDALFFHCVMKLGFDTRTKWLPLWIFLGARKSYSEVVVGWLSEFAMWKVF
jgi:hypothetical protein